MRLRSCACTDAPLQGAPGVPGAGAERTSTSLRSQSVSTCCTSSLVRPGFQHERNRLLRNSAAHSSSAIFGAALASAEDAPFFFVPGVGAEEAGADARGAVPPNRFFLGLCVEPGVFSATRAQTQRQGGGSSTEACGVQVQAPIRCAGLEYAATW